ncbi:helix-turn-helix domain-containing protein [Paracoccus sp. SM22M-07]|uniref:helix-turn-helix domain-containing protein n=1 Tax=Paracoccus sp. SM22M-07 TaxID=1520813 RepID=UPI000918C6E4|nr:helix-turn-helix domain-containing protein [Paracoccus sp. SM22M-07]OJH45172.1 hypothetical protein IE00_05780 [Paracoccus sp. SM22M-07]
MSIAHMEAVFQSDLGPTPRLVMLALADHADGRGQCYPSVERICARTGLSDRAVQKNIKSLIDAGWLTIQKGGGRGRANAYLVNANPEPRSPFQEINPEPETPFLMQNPERGSLNPEPRSLNPEPGSPQPSGTTIEPEDGAEDAREASLPSGASLVSRLTHALGFDHHGIVPKYWATADAPMIVSRWISDLGLTPEEVIHVARSNSVAHGSPANGPKTLTRHMQDFAAAKAAPKLTPTEGMPHAQPARFPSGRQHTGTGQQLSGLAGAAMRSIASRQQGHGS